MNKHELLNRSLTYFSRHNLIIKDKSGKLVPFRLNKPQEYIHKRLEAQKRDKGYVRAIVVKARQQGCSTYIAARFFHRSVRNLGVSTFILSHEAKTTSKLFEMVKTYHEKMPDAVTPVLGASNANQFVFSKLGSDYTVGTAGNEATGRGGTIQLFHGSEVAFWKGTEGIKTGVMQSVPTGTLAQDTEIILESTANGMGNMFHQMVVNSLKGKGEYIVIFTPWFWSDEYRAPVPEGFVPNKEEAEYMQLHGLSLEQVAWMRTKLEELDDKWWRFRQEYPSTLQEAFQTSGDSLCRPNDIIRARSCATKDLHAPVILSCDPGREGDRTVIMFRRGRQLVKYFTYDFSGQDQIQMKIAGKISYFIHKYKPDAIFIDVGEGWGVIDRLKELGHKRVVGVPFGSGADDDKTYLNKRAEMWVRMRDWFKEPDTNIPDDDELAADVMSVPDYEQTSSGRIKLIAKDKIKTAEFYGKSPDIGDALALSFAFMVAPKAHEPTIKKKIKGTQIQSLRRKRGLDSQRNMEYKIPWGGL